MTTNLRWWIPTVLLAAAVVVGGGLRAQRSHRDPAHVSCGTRELRVDMNGDGKPALVRIERYDDEAWADVWDGNAVRSTTRVGDWREDAEIEARDVNGDGKQDLVRSYRDDAGRRRAEVWLSNGFAFERGAATPVALACLTRR